jgi:cyclopropane fatty-acyl-phospholipid synthase-like methyltransferase
MWDEIGRLQFEKLRSEGLQPHHRLLDVGCGALRGGIHFARYLAPGNYHGIDINPSLLEAGRKELAAAGLADRNVRLHVTDCFDATAFGVPFDFGISVSLFTHVTANHIILCFSALKSVMHRESRFFFTFFEAPRPAHYRPIEQVSGAFTFYTQDCFHYAFSEIEAFARLAGLECLYHGNWGHPRNQKLVEIRLLPKTAV